MKNVFKASMLAFLILLIAGCHRSSGGSSGSNNANNNKPNNNSGYSGVYLSASGQSLFFHSDESSVYLYHPPVFGDDGIEWVHSNRVIRIENKLKGNSIKTVGFTLSSSGDYYQDDFLPVDIVFSNTVAKANIYVPDLDSDFKKLNLQSDFDLAYQSFTDFNNINIHFLPNNTFTANITDIGSCDVSAKVIKKNSYYKLTNGSIRCTNSDDFRIDSNMNGVIYKTGDKAILTMHGNKWTYSTTFDISM